MDAREPVARLLGRLLLRELDEAALAELGVPEVRDALRGVGIELPEAGELEELAAQYFALFVQPQDSAPPVQSLWAEGAYEGESARSVRALAEAAGLEFDREAARSAPVDHLGSILWLWAEARTARPEVAARLEQQHFDWAAQPLARAAREGGFYGAVCAATADFMGSLRADAVP